MLIIKHGTVINLNNVFSMRLTGAGNRTITFRGSDSLSAELYFPDKGEANMAIDRILTSSAAVVDLDIKPALSEDTHSERELQSGDLLGK